MEEQISLYGMGLESVQETILTCRDKGILAEYLEAREEEVTKIMMDLYDRQQIAERYGESLAREAAEEAAKTTEKEMVERMIRLGKFPLEDIAACAPSFSLDDLRKMEEASRQAS